MKLDHPTIVKVDLGNILFNISQIRKLVGRKVMIMAVVKADAYGHGAVAVSKSLRGKVDYLSVATLSEAMELKNAGIKTPILLLSETAVKNAEHVVRNGFVQTVYTYQLAKALSNAAVRTGKKARVHFKIDTGMGRIGASLGDAIPLYNSIRQLPGIKIEGIFTHFSRADEDLAHTALQLKKFNSVARVIASEDTILHAANSAATIDLKESHLDMVRVGLSMYGLYPGKTKNILLKPALELKTRVVYLKQVPKGTQVSYGGTYITKNMTTIATLPVGYADGLPRLMSNKGEVLIRGKRFPIVGRVCMDLTLVDVGSSKVKVGDEVIIIGRQGKSSISAEEVAKHAGTINYEIICGLRKRVPRIYIK
jgi:alanine racemase